MHFTRLAHIREPSRVPVSAPPRCINFRYFFAPHFAHVARFFFFILEYFARADILLQLFDPANGFPIADDFAIGH